MDVAEEHMIGSLDARNATSLYLATYLHEKLSNRILEFIYEAYSEVSATTEYADCFKEVGQGLWPHGGDALFKLVKTLCRS